jgi:hypothetical protein
MKQKAIAAALLVSAIALAAGIGNAPEGTRNTVNAGTQERGAFVNALSADASTGYILSTVSADFALPGRLITV